MTNKEAIETIKANYQDERYTMLREALDMAMELLKAQEQNPCDLQECEPPCGGKENCEFRGMDGFCKAYQGPRVMTLEEIISAECVWIEYATSGNVVIAFPWDIELTDDTYNFIGMPNCFVEFRSLYGEEWRCWNSRPTDEQRRAVKWE